MSPLNRQKRNKGWIRTWQCWLALGVLTTLLILTQRHTIAEGVGGETTANCPGDGGGSGECYVDTGQECDQTKDYPYYSDWRWKSHGTATADNPPAQYVAAGTELTASASYAPNLNVSPGKKERDKTICQGGSEQVLTPPESDSAAYQSGEYRWASNGSSTIIVSTDTTLSLQAKISCTEFLDKSTWVTVSSVEVKIITLDIITPNQDYLNQGDTKTLTATTQPAGRTITWSVSPNDKVDITEHGTLFFKPYGDTWLSDFDVTVTACDSETPDTKDTQLINVIGFSRPGNAVFTDELDPNQWVFAQSVTAHGYAAENSQEAGIVKVQYQSDEDRCSGQVTQRRLKYHIKTHVYAFASLLWSDITYVYAAVMVGSLQNGVPSLSDSVGVREGDGSPLSIGMNGAGLVTAAISLTETQAPRTNDQDLLIIVSDSSHISIHAPTSSVNLEVPVIGYVSTKAYGGYASFATANGYVGGGLQNLPSSESQYSTLDAITFKPKAPESP